MKALRVPLSVSLCITKACNLQCLHCGADAGRRGPSELSTDEWLKVIDEITELKVFMLEVTGGEPLSAPDFWNIMERVKPWQSVCVRSNGTLIDDDVAIALSRLPCKLSVSVSLDGSSPRNVDALRGPGTFEATVRGISSLVHARVPISVSFVVSKLNLDDMLATAQLLQQLGVRSLSIGYMHPQGRYLDNASFLAPTVSELFEFAAQVEQAAKQHPTLTINANEFMGRVDYLKKAAQIARENTKEPGSEGTVPVASICSAGSTSCAITSEGWVVPCCYCEGIEEYNVRHVSLLYAWQNASSLQIMRKLKETPVTALEGCQGCNLAALCSPGCRAAAFRLTGSLCARNPETCLLSMIGGAVNQPTVA